jgi:phosphatidylinositol-3,4,5-trisphosphate 3-phosphatase/dual-specificity protein phosphatase PTEN
MSFPASTWKEKYYRNDIDRVADYFDSKHPNSYWIYNMSNRPIDNSKFHDRVNPYSWADHHSPALSLLFESCDHMFKFLNENNSNVVAVNCNAGKGRTGTSISCFLMYSGLSDNFIHAITYYGWKRFKTGRGVSQPSQQRYVQYFEMAFKRQIQSPSLKRLNKVIINTIPSSTGKEVKPCIEIMDGKNFEMIWTNNPNYKGKDMKNVIPKNCLY